MKLMKNIFASWLLVYAMPTFAAGVDEQSYFDKVFGVISARNVLDKNGEKLFRELKGICLHKELDGPAEAAQGNVQCRSDAAVERLIVYGTSDPKIESITATIRGAEKCEYMRKALIKNFGRPSDVKGDCYMEWKVKGAKGGGRTLISLQSVKKESMVYFSIGREDQP